MIEGVWSRTKGLPDYPFWCIADTFFMTGLYMTDFEHPTP